MLKQQFWKMFSWVILNLCFGLFERCLGVSGRCLEGVLATPNTVWVAVMPNQSIKIQEASF